MCYRKQRVLAGLGWFVNDLSDTVTSENNWWIASRVTKITTHGQPYIVSFCRFFAAVTKGGQFWPAIVTRECGDWRCLVIMADFSGTRQLAQHWYSLVDIINDCLFPYCLPLNIHFVVSITSTFVLPFVWETVSNRSLNVENRYHIMLLGKSTYCVSMDRIQPICHWFVNES